jgi:hypothetical protein
LAGLACALLAASPAQADQNTDWQERHTGTAFLAGGWMDMVNGDELVMQGDRLVIRKARGGRYRDFPAGFPVVSNIRFKETQRANASTVYYQFSATCNRPDPRGGILSSPAQHFTVNVTSSITGGLLEAFTAIQSSCTVKLDRPWALMPLAEAADPANLAAPADDPAFDQAFLREAAGLWETRFENDDRQVDIAGREIRLVRSKPITSPHRNPPGPGDLVGVFDGAKPWGKWRSPITGEMKQLYAYFVRTLTTDGKAWVMSTSPSVGMLRYYTHSVEDRSSSRRRPVLDYASVGGNNGTWFGDMWRPADKARIFGKAPLPAARAASPARPAAAAPTTRFTPPPSTAATAAAATAARPAPLPPAAASEAAQSVPVSSVQEQAELAAREQLNREQAAFAARQLSENRAAQEAFDKATQERAATIARQQAEYQAALAAQAAEAARRNAEHAAAMERWRADVAACKAGNTSRCAPEPPQR